MDDEEWQAWQRMTQRKMDRALFWWIVMWGAIGVAAVAYMVQSIAHLMGVQ